MNSSLKLDTYSVSVFLFSSLKVPVHKSRNPLHRFLLLLLFLKHKVLKISFKQFLFKFKFETKKSKRLYLDYYLDYRNKNMVLKTYSRQSSTLDAMSANSQHSNVYRTHMTSIYYSYRDIIDFN